MNMCMRAVAALSLMVLAGNAAAIPTLKSVTATFHQAGSGSGTVNAGVIVTAETSLPVLIIAGGFTITCTSSSLPLTAEARRTFTGFLGIDATLRIPAVVPSRYSIPGFTEIAMGYCGQCVMQYKGEAKDETTLSVRVGNQGVGATFTLIPAGEQLVGNTQLISVCRPPQRQCCTPLCAIP
jgi:hypothetical protein